MGAYDEPHDTTKVEKRSERLERKMAAKLRKSGTLGAVGVEKGSRTIPGSWIE